MHRCTYCVVSTDTTPDDLLSIRWQRFMMGPQIPNGHGNLKGTLPAKALEQLKAAVERTRILHLQPRILKDHEQS